MTHAAVFPTTKGLNCIRLLHRSADKHWIFSGGGVCGGIYFWGKAFNKNRFGAQWRRSPFRLDADRLLILQWRLLWNLVDAVTNSRSAIYAASALICKQCHVEIFTKQDCIPVGCIPRARWPYLPVCSARGGGLPGPGGCLVWGVPAWSRGCGIPACTEADPPPVNRRLWKHYFAQTSLRAVTKHHCAK